MASSPPSEESQNQNQDRQQVAAVKEQEKECLHKTKTIEFLGRTTPIVLQNDNGPCPLLAICNHFLSPSCSFVHLVFFFFFTKVKRMFLGFREIREVRLQSNLIMENDRVRQS
jgi:hypothetical protein